MALVKKTPPPPVTPVPETDTTKIRTQGLQLLQPLQPEVQRLAIASAADYLIADGLLGRVRNARKQWAVMLAPVTLPIQKMKVEMKNLEQGVKRLDQDVDGPMATIEGQIKELMRQWKLKEAEQKRLEEANKALEQAARQTQIDAARRKEEAARTAPMRARLQEQREKLEQQAAEEQLEDLNPEVKGSSSSARKLEKVTITDPLAFVQAMLDYQPRMGVYEFAHPPLSLFPVEVILNQLTKLYREQPQVVRSWPGVEIVEDIQIAGR